MKKIISLMSLMICLTLVSVAQEVPSKISDAFKAKYPKAESNDWELNNNNNWETYFDIDGVEHSVTYSDTGEWLKSEHQIRTSELPANILDQLKKDFGDFEVAEVEQIESAKGVGYEVDLYDGDQELELEFDDAGKLIAKKITNDTDDEMEDE